MNKDRPTPLPRSFYAEDALKVASSLLGCVLHHGSGPQSLAGIITEVEAYRGALDDASHAYRGLTPRTEVMFGAPGHAYVYLIYGMWSCMNVVCAEEGVAEAVLIRSVVPIAGIEQMEVNRQGRKPLAEGPGRLCQAMGITRSLNGADLTGTDLWISGGERLLPFRTTPRIGIDYAEQSRGELWRFVADSDAVQQSIRKAVPLEG